MLTQTAPPDVAAAHIPAQRRDPEAPWPGQMKEAKRLMRRLWACDPATADELCDGLAAMSRTQLGRVIDNLMWILANQPRPMNAAQWQRIQLLWPRKMSKPMDDKVIQRFARMTEGDADRAIRRMIASPDRVVVAA